LSGPGYFHLRRPGAERSAYESFIRQIPEQWRSRVSIHAHHEMAREYGLGGIHITRDCMKKERDLFRYTEHFSDMRTSLSCHTKDELLERDHPVTYVFLSPVFNSISKPSHQAGFAADTIKDMIDRYHDMPSPRPVIALGGIDAPSLPWLSECGFSGAAFLGSVWNLPTCEERKIKINTLHELCHHNIPSPLPMHWETGPMR
jgi:thiamine-phosphate pyrophosphorylase